MPENEYDVQIDYRGMPVLDAEDREDLESAQDAIDAIEWWDRA